jgi:hypothetical protein
MRRVKKMKTAPEASSEQRAESSGEAGGVSGGPGGRTRAWIPPLRLVPVTDLARPCLTHALGWAFACPVHGCPPVSRKPSTCPGGPWRAPVLGPASPEFDFPLSSTTPHMSLLPPPHTERAVHCADALNYRHYLQWCCISRLAGTSHRSQGLVRPPLPGLKPLLARSGQRAAVPGQRAAVPGAWTK